MHRNRQSTVRRERKEENGINRQKRATDESQQSDTRNCTTEMCTVWLHDCCSIRTIHVSCPFRPFLCLLILTIVWRLMTHSFFLLCFPSLSPLLLFFFSQGDSFPYSSETCVSFPDSLWLVTTASSSLSSLLFRMPDQRSVEREGEEGRRNRSNWLVFALRILRFDLLVVSSRPFLLLLHLSCFVVFRGYISLSLPLSLMPVHHHHSRIPLSLSFWVRSLVSWLSDPSFFLSSLSPELSLRCPSFAFSLFSLSLVSGSRSFSHPVVSPSPGSEPECESLPVTPWLSWSSLCSCSPLLLSVRTSYFTTYSLLYMISLSILTRRSFLSHYPMTGQSFMPCSPDSSVRFLPPFSYVAVSSTRSVCMSHTHDSNNNRQQRLCGHSICVSRPIHRYIVTTRNRRCLSAYQTGIDSHLTSLVLCVAVAFVDLQVHILQLLPHHLISRETHAQLNYFPKKKRGEAKAIQYKEIMAWNLIKTSRASIRSDDQISRWMVLKRFFLLLLAGKILFTPEKHSFRSFVGETSSLYPDLCSCESSFILISRSILFVSPVLLIRETGKRRDGGRKSATSERESPEEKGPKKILVSDGKSLTTQYRTVHLFSLLSSSHF